LLPVQQHLVVLLDRQIAGIAGIPNQAGWPLNERRWRLGARLRCHIN
jgi:hypothetical protein